MPNNESPFQIIATQSTSNPREYQFSILEDGEPINENSYEFAWDFGSAGTSDEASPVVVFSNAGEVSVSCVVTPAITPKPDEDDVTPSPPPPPPPIILEIT